MTQTEKLKTDEEKYNKYGFLSEESIFYFIIYLFFF